MSDAAPLWQGRVIADSPVPRLLRTHPAIVLERIAFGGGGTNWYHCRDHTQLDIIAAELRPGSLVSFYFDDRIARCRYTPQVREQMLQLMRACRDAGDSGEIVVGIPASDGRHIEVDFPGGPMSLDEFTADLAGDSWVYFGEFPGGENDGVHAVTLVLPDRDGIIRSHPY